MLKVGHDRVGRDGEFGRMQGWGRGGTQVEFRDGRIEARFQRAVQFRVVAFGRVFVRVVIRTFFMTPSMLLVRGFKREVPVPVDADHHAAIQAEATACQDGKADEDAGSNPKRHLGVRW